ncbi:hypothetical protein [Catellatospora sp. NPDC049609]|uniref:hypothetical protein n=1 Tax=Catellatospora sp. NPDC049609 TaxID=3155505 RepID=UPI00344AE0D5
MTDPQPSGDGGALDDATRERLLALLQAELSRAGAEALARGVSPAALASYLDERAALLRARIDEASAARGAAVEDGPDRRDDAG